MRHAPYTRTPNPHTPVKPRGLALIPLVTPHPIPGSAVLTPGSSLGSYIVPTDQHESFVRTLSSLMRTRENFPVGHPSQIAPSQACLTWRFFRDRLPKKKMHLVDMITLLILLSLRPGYPIPGARISQSTPLEDRRPRRSIPIQEPPLLAMSVCLVSSYAMPCDHFGSTCAMRHIPEPSNPHTPVKPRGSALIPLVTPHPIPGPAVLTPGSSLGSYIVSTDQHESFVCTLSSLMRSRKNFPTGHPSQIAPSQKKMHFVDMITLLILLSLGPGYPILGAMISHLRLLITSPLLVAIHTNILGVHKNNIIPNMRTNHVRIFYVLL
jgi:hypothetical protein